MKKETDEQDHSRFGVFMIGLIIGYVLGALFIISMVK